MKIYTRGGDKGHTQVYFKQAERVSKADRRLELYGDLDELNSHVGLLISLISNQQPALANYLNGIQRDLFQLGFVVSAESTLTAKNIDSLESEIDRMSAELAPMTSFILPGGCQAACQAHICRTVCRRAERLLAALAEEHEVAEISQSYINRLSDYFFVVARHVNFLSKIDDIKL